MKKTQDNTKLSFKLMFVSSFLTAVIILTAFYFAGVPTHKKNADHDHLKDKTEELLYTCSMHPFIITEEPGSCPVCGMNLVPKQKEKQPEGSKERKIAYWKAPMNPEEIYDKPGKSAMGMDLVPVYEDELSSGVEITINPVIRQNMGIRTQKAFLAPLIHTIRTFGHLTYDETRTVQVSPRYSGWVEKLHVNFKGQMVKKGQALFTIYSPELITAQEEYLEALRSSKKQTSGYGSKILKSAKRRLENYNISKKEIRSIESGNQAKNSITIRSPFTGVVSVKNIIEGGYFKAGTNLYTISDLSKIWVEAHVYEYELSRISEDMNAEITLPYHPGKVYKGKVTYIYPYLQKKTRDVVIRLEFENPELELKPDMYANVQIKTSGDKQGLVIPSEAVIRSGEQNLVFLTDGDGRFFPRNVTPGLSLDNGNIHILTGIAPNELVVTSGQFLLDSESKLKEAVNKMLEADQPEKDPKDSEPDNEDDFFNDM